MTEELRKKKLVNAGHRASATCMVNRAEELLAEESTDVTRLSQRRLSLLDKLDVLKRLDGEILDHVAEEAIAEEIEHSDGFKESVHTVLVMIEHLLRARTPPPILSPIPSHRDSMVEHEGTSRVSKLPKLTIQPFKGDLTAWIMFWDSYKAAIHENHSLSEIDMFNYLRSLLQGPALGAVSGLTLTAANYDEAVSALEKRFWNKQQIIVKHMGMLLNVESITSNYNLKGLKQLYDTVESCARIKVSGCISRLLRKSAILRPTEQAAPRGQTHHQTS